MTNQNTCQRCGKETNDRQKCKDCGTVFCWKCIGVPQINPGDDLLPVGSYCPECKSENTIPTPYS